MAGVVEDEELGALSLPRERIELSDELRGGRIVLLAQRCGRHATELAEHAREATHVVGRVTKRCLIGVALTAADEERATWSGHRNAAKRQRCEDETGADEVCR